MKKLSKKLSKKLFQQYLEQHNKVYTDNIAIDCSNLDGKIKDHDVFTFCREVFKKPFHFDHVGIAFELKDYKRILNTPGRDNLYGISVSNGYDIIKMYNNPFIININSLIPRNVRLKATLDTDLKFDPEKI